MVALTSRRSLVFWAGWVVFALLLMPLVGSWPWIYLLCVAGSALLLHSATRCNNGVDLRRTLRLATFL
jgi:hypothetical protein